VTRTVAVRGYHESGLTRRPGSTRKLPMHAPGMYPRGHEPTGDGVSTVIYYKVCWGRYESAAYAPSDVFTHGPKIGLRMQRARVSTDEATQRTRCTYDRNCHPVQKHPFDFRRGKHAGTQLTWLLKGWTRSRGHRKSVTCASRVWREAPTLTAKP
jgi:hypothetical protein